MATIKIHKMDGTGNDFVIADLRGQDFVFSNTDIIKLSDRRNNLTHGCDQFIVLRESEKADVFMQIFNSDGSSSSACGNASRCVASLIMKETGSSSVNIETEDQILTCYKLRNEIEVNMGEPRLKWNEIPVSSECDTLKMSIGFGSLQNPVGVSMGNPHAVFFVEKIKDINLHDVAPQIQANKFFPEGVNVGIAEVISKEHILLRVYERGAGETAACGTGACAAVVATFRRGLTARTVRVTLSGGDLFVTWAADGDVWLRGNFNHHFEKAIQV